MNTLTHDAESDVWAWAVGSGIALIQVCAVIPGLLPFLLLCLPFVLPFAVLGIVAGVLIGVPVGLWRLAAWAVRPLVSRTRGPDPAIPTPETTNA